MDYDDLMRSMDASADEKKAELIRKARESAKAIEEDARKKADEIAGSRISSASRALEVDRNRLLYEARSEAQKEIAGIKHEYFSRAFRIAEERLSAFRGQSGYEEFFRRAMVEAIEALGENDFVLNIDGRDEELCRSIVGSLGIRCTVKADLSCAGGLNVSTPDGKVVIFNDIGSRSKAARERLKLEIFSRLFGD
jgi:V/A-type H+-transporting ATPase subunit E